MSHCSSVENKFNEYEVEGCLRKCLSFCHLGNIFMTLTWCYYRKYGYYRKYINMACSTRMFRRGIYRCFSRVLVDRVILRYSHE